MRPYINMVEFRSHAEQQRNHEVLTNEEKEILESMLKFPSTMEYAKIIEKAVRIALKVND